MGVVHISPFVPESVSGTVVPVPRSAQIVWDEVVSVTEVESGACIRDGAIGALVNFRAGGAVGVPPPTMVYDSSWGRRS